MTYITHSLHKAFPGSFSFDWDDTFSHSDVFGNSYNPITAGDRKKLNKAASKAYQAAAAVPVAFMNLAEAAANKTFDTVNTFGELYTKKGKTSFLQKLWNHKKKIIFTAAVVGLVWYSKTHGTQLPPSDPKLYPTRPPFCPTNKFSSKSSIWHNPKINKCVKFDLKSSLTQAWKAIQSQDTTALKKLTSHISHCVGKTVSKKSSEAESAIRLVVFNIKDSNAIEKAQNLIETISTSSQAQLKSALHRLGETLSSTADKL
jgi:hypothetical protein